MALAIGESYEMDHWVDPAPVPTPKMAPRPSDVSTPPSVHFAPCTPSSTTSSELSDASTTAGETVGKSRGARAGEASEPPLLATIISTSNTYDEDPWLPVQTVVTLFNIRVDWGEQDWEVLRRYSDFLELHTLLSRAFGSLLPPMPPRLLFNADPDIADRMMELDRYLRKLLSFPAVARHHRVQEFLGVSKHGVRYGVRRYEYDSSQSEGNRYIRDGDL